MAQAKHMFLEDCYCPVSVNMSFGKEVGLGNMFTQFLRCQVTACHCQISLFLFFPVKGKIFNIFKARKMLVQDSHSR